MPSAHVDILSKPPFSLPESFRAIDKAIESNALIAEQILDAGLVSFSISLDDVSWHGTAKPSDVDKARSTINQLYREWSSDGLPERHAGFSPLLAALDSHLPSVPPDQRHQYRVLIPGAGLGRLVLEVSTAGYTAEGNEISYHQVLASTYILNYTKAAEKHRLYPFVSIFNNHLSRADQLQVVEVPDIHHSEVHSSDRMSLTVGDFCSLYTQPKYKDSFDAILTCFFIDTASNIIRYIETVKHCLKPGGIWCNNGPLLWHSEVKPPSAAGETEPLDEIVSATTYSDSTSRGSDTMPVEHGSFELTNEEVIALVKLYDFEILEQKEALMGTTGYVQNSASMLQHVYEPSFWVAKNMS